MPSRVWKCDYCGDINKSFDETNIHEKKCKWNPKNKHCYSCSNYSNYSDEPFYMRESRICLKNLSMDYFEDHGGCKGWE